MSKRLTFEQRERLQAELEGTCEELEAVLERLGLDVSIETAEDQLLDGNGMERCGECGWWFGSSSLEKQPDGTILCDQCSEKD